MSFHRFNGRRPSNTQNQSSSGGQQRAGEARRPEQGHGEQRHGEQRRPVQGQPPRAAASGTAPRPPSPEYRRPFQDQRRPAPESARAADLPRRPSERRPAPGDQRRPQQHRHQHQPQRHQHQPQQRRDERAPNTSVAARPLAPPTPELLERIQASPFSALGLAEPLVRAVLEEGYVQPSPIQTEVVPHAIAGRDLIGCAQTGTGKTAAFVLPMLHHLRAGSSQKIRALILTPTRELAAQIAERVTAYGSHVRVPHAVIYGGVGQRGQEHALAAHPALVVATPGRLLDLIQQRLVDLSGITHFVLDEADRMLDMGFVHDVRRVVALLPQQRQTLFFSATMAPAVEKLARSMLNDPVRVAIAPAETSAKTVEQSVVFVSKADKPALLQDVLSDESVERALVFTRTKHGANRLSDRLGRAGIGSAAIHGNKSQGARERALESFKRGSTRVLVATDLAARGIDVEGVSLVVNFDLPNVPESYVHRIGRTGRAGASGRAISFCDKDERSFLADIERLLRHRLPVAGADSVQAKARG